MSTAPWFRFFPSDWLGGTRGLTDRQTGVYISLIAMMYDHREPLRNDADLLARMCGSPSTASFRTVLQSLIEQGKITLTDAGLWNDRVQEELKVFRKNSDLQSHRASSRWSKKDKENKPDAMPRQSPGNAIPEARSHISSLRSDIKGTAVAAPTPKSELASVLDDLHVKAVIDHRQRLRKPLTAHAAHLLAARLAACPDPNAAADLMVVKGWQSIEPAWLQDRVTSQRQTSPPREPTLADFFADEAKRLQEEEDARTIETSYGHGHIDLPH